MIIFKYNHSLICIPSPSLLYLHINHYISIKYINLTLVSYINTKKSNYEILKYKTQRQYILTQTKFYNHISNKSLST